MTRYRFLVSDRELGIYLNDHLTGAGGGVALARRAASNAASPERARMWEEVSGQVAEDRETLNRIRDRVGARPNRIKYAAGWVGERLGRLKTNGRLRRRTDLGQMLELELLVIGVTGKLALWRALAELDDPRLREFDFGALGDRAESQRERLERARIELAPEALGSDG